MEIREVTRNDVDAIVALTQNTFEWGDYIPDRISGWLDDSVGVVMVADTGSDIIGVGRVMLMSPREAWSHAVRVHPDHRGRGVAGDLLDALCRWSVGEGAQVVRLLIDDTNEASKRHVTKNDFRRVATAVRAVRSVGEATPNPEGNGGRSTSTVTPARRVKAADSAMLAAAWSTSTCGRAMRGLVATEWHFANLGPDRVEESARAGGVWEMGSSWAVIQQFDTTFDVALLDTDESDALGAIRALIDLANERGSDEFLMWIADLDWLIQAARRAGCQTESFGIWVRSL